MKGLLLLPLTLLRLVGQCVLLSLSQIWANKVRSLLTTIGIVIGVASVTAVIAAMMGLKVKVLGEFEKIGANKIFIIPDVPQTGPMKRANWRQLRLTPEQFDDLLDHCPSVGQFTRVNYNQHTIRHGQSVAEDVPVLGIEATWHQIENRSVTQGRPFSHIDCSRATNVCLINSKLQEKLSLDRECVGESIVISSRTFIIVGVLEPRVESGIFRGGGASDYEVFIPFKTSWRQMQNMNYAMASSKSAEVSDDARAELRFFLRQTRHVKLGDPDTFRLLVVEEYLKQIKVIAAVLTAVATGIVGISLLVGGIGIMNIMLVSVSERTREIGLRKAVGARPSEILLQFLVEAVTLCFLGGLLGLLFGQLLTAGMAAIPDAGLDKAYIPLWAVALAFGFSATVGVLFGMFPAIKAARLNPIDALRHE